MKNNKKTILFILLIVALGIVGTTIAYYTSEDTFRNQFNAGSYVIETQENFQSPDNWTPGTTTPKDVIATNRGNTPAAVRVKLVPSWEDENGNSLPLFDNNGNEAAIINFSSDKDIKWTKEGDYYYYNLVLNANESSSSLIESVTFNPDVLINKDSNCIENQETHEVVCTTETTGYGGGKYKLQVIIETAQYDKYKEIWDTDVDISTELGKNLYARVASQSQGTLDNTEGNQIFLYGSMYEVDNYPYGVYKLKSEENETYPIYFFRGMKPLKNHVLFDGKCWEIIRTTELGGTRILYEGEAVDGKCSSTRTSTSSSTRWLGNNYENVYGTSYIQLDNGRFKVTGDTITGKWNNSSICTSSLCPILNYYTCESSNVNDACDRIYKITGWESDSSANVEITELMPGYIKMYRNETNGVYDYSYYLKEGFSESNLVTMFGYQRSYDTPDGYMFKTEVENDTDSELKKVLDRWYEDGLSNSSKSYIEDSIYCADRSRLTNEQLADFNQPVPINYFSSYYRLTKGTPSTHCPNSNDSYTVSSGLLKYPIGFISADDAILTGAAYNYSSSFISSNSVNFWLGSPQQDDYGYCSNSIVSNWGIINTYYIRPVISLKHDTKYLAGDGSQNSPYIIN